MKPEEAIEILSEALRYSVYTNGEDWEALELFKYAADKQIPKKPEEVKSALDYDTFGCPSCHFSVGWTDGINGMLNKFCPNCGQAIDWSTDEN